MPLLDHFHPPLSTARHWESFLAAWASVMVGGLNRGILPPGYFAEAQVHVGSRVDVASFEREGPPPQADNGSGVAVRAWVPPAARLVMPAVFPDEIEVQVYSTSGGPMLVAAVELISPGNKDRPETRRAFAAKCAGYLQMGIGLVIVDIVTERPANLHDELIHLLGQADTFRFPEQAALYAVAYRPLRTEARGDQIDLWPIRLGVGRALPTLPLALRGAVAVPLHLEASYEEARQASRL